MTVQNLYTQYLDGKITKQKFLYEVRRDQNLDMISSSNSFDDVVKILKNKSIISEKAHKEAKLATGKQEVDIIAKTIDMVNPYEYTRGMNYELEILDIPASEGDLSEDNILKAQKKVLANLTKNSQYYGEKMHGKGEVGHEWIEATKKEIEKIGKGKSKMIREGLDEIGMFHDPIGYKKSELNPADKVYTKEYQGNGIYKIFKNGKLVKTIEGEGNANAWMNQAQRADKKGMDEVFEGGFVSRGAILKALEDVGSESEIRQYLTSLEKSGDKFENVDDYVEDFRNYVADKSLNEHGQYADRVADVNADSSPLKEREKAIYEKYAEKTGIPMENLMSMVRDAKAKKMEEAIALKDKAGNIQYAKDSTEASNIERAAKSKGVTLTKTQA
jgi:hypothetical protein